MFKTQFLKVRKDENAGAWRAWSRASGACGWVRPHHVQAAAAAPPAMTSRTGVAEDVVPGRAVGGSPGAAGKHTAARTPTGKPQTAGGESEDSAPGQRVCLAFRSRNRIRTLSRECLPSLLLELSNSKPSLNEYWALIKPGGY